MISISPTLLPFLVLAALALYAVIIYNGLVTLRNSVSKAWSNIDVLLKQRYDEVPRLVAVCETYMKHERITLERVVQARSMRDCAAGLEQHAKASNTLTSALGGLFAVSENYPDLKADVNFRQLQARISELEDQIADRREFYNESVTIYNTHVQKFPDSIIASMFGYVPARLWKINPLHRENVNVFISK